MTGPIAVTTSIPPSTEWWRDLFVADHISVLFPQQPKQNKAEVAVMLKATNLRIGSRVLDLCCGIGRHSIEFARRGMQVVGIDQSSDFVEVGRRAAKDDGVDGRVSFLQGDMRCLEALFPPHTFDLVVLAFNSFGYFESSDEDLTVLRQIRAMLRPSGKALFEVLNPSSARSSANPPANKVAAPILGIAREVAPGLIVINDSWFELASRHLWSKWTIVDTRATPALLKRLSFRQSLYTRAQYREMLASAGLMMTSSWGALLGEHCDPAQSLYHTFVAEANIHSVISE